MSRIKAARALRGLENPAEKMSKCLLAMMKQYLKPWQVRFMCRILEGRVIDLTTTLDEVMLAQYDQRYIINDQMRDQFVQDYETAYRAYLADGASDNDRWTFFDGGIPSSDAEVNAALTDKYVDDRWRTANALGRAVVLRGQNLAPYSRTMRRVGDKAVETNPTPPPPPRNLPPQIRTDKGGKIVLTGGVITTSDRTADGFKWTTTSDSTEAMDDKEE